MNNGEILHNPAVPLRQVVTYDRMLPSSSKNPALILRFTRYLPFRQEKLFESETLIHLSKNDNVIIDKSNSMEHQESKVNSIVI